MPNYFIRKGDHAKVDPNFLLSALHRAETTSPQYLASDSKSIKVAADLI